MLLETHIVTVKPFSIEIPGEPTIRRTYNVPPVTVTLPLKIHGRRAFLALLAPALFLVGVLIVVDAAFLPIRLFDRTYDWSKGVEPIIFCPFAIAIGVYMVAACFGTAVDAASSRILSITMDGVYDHRVKIFVRWERICFG